MTIDLAAYSRLRPYLFHLTASENLPRIKRTRVLESAAILADQAHNRDLIGTRRRVHVTVHIEDDQVIIRDQAPLHAGNMKLEAGWTYERFVDDLNRRVFFWPGNSTAPISYGRRHFARYESEKPVITRIAFRSLMEANQNAVARFSKCNSGSPRWSRGIAASRGPATFVTANVAAFKAAQVVEVTFLDRVHIPDDAMWSYELGGSWSPL